MLTEYYFAVRYGDIIILLYHEDMMSLRELLFKNNQKKKTLKRFFRILLHDRCKSSIRRFERRKNQRVKGSS